MTKAQNYKNYYLSIYYLFFKLDSVAKSMINCLWFFSFFGGGLKMSDKKVKLNVNRSEF